MRVVVVDDDQLVAISLKTILEADASIEVAETGYREEKQLHFTKNMSRMFF